MSVALSTALSSTAVAVSNGPASVIGVDFFNPGASVAYVQLFSAPAASVTVGTTVARDVLAIPAGGGKDFYFGEIGEDYPGGVSMAATTTSTGSTAPGTALLGKVYYR